MLIKFLVAFFFGGVVGLDTTAAWQVLFSHPLISCTLMGLAFGEPQLGLFFGIIFELIWFYDMPVGGARFPEGNVGSFLGLMLVLAFQDEPAIPAGWLLLAGIVYAVVVSYIFGVTIVWMRRRNLKLVEWADRYAAEGNAKMVGRMHLLGVLHAYFHGAIWSLLLYIPGIFALRWTVPLLRRFPPLNVELVQAIMLGVGMAVMFQLFLSRRRSWHLLLGVVCGVTLAVVL